MTSQRWLYVNLNIPRRLFCGQPSGMQIPERAVGIKYMKCSPVFLSTEGRAWRCVRSIARLSSRCSLWTYSSILKYSLPLCAAGPADRIWSKYAIFPRVRPSHLLRQRLRIKGNVTCLVRLIPLGRKATWLLNCKCQFTYILANLGA